MEDVLDVLRAVVQGLRAVGGLTEPDHNQALAIVDANDPKAAAAAVPAFSDVEAAELARLLAKQQASAAGQPTPPPAPPQQPQPAPVAVPGQGFYQPANQPAAVPQFVQPGQVPQYPQPQQPVYPQPQQPPPVPVFPLPQQATP